MLLAFVGLDMENQHSQLLGEDKHQLDAVDLPHSRDVDRTRPRYRFDLSEIEVRWDSSTQALWSFMTPTLRPAFNPLLLRDLQAWQNEIGRSFASGDPQLKYVILGSRVPGVFNLGGDLSVVAGMIEAGDLDGLVRYAYLCVEILYRNMTAQGLPVVTIALIQGETVGGGFETALSFDVLVAERQARFSLPENAFGLFPGVGAHSILTRRLGAAKAEQIMLSGKTFTAEELYDLGLVHVLAETGEGEAAVQDYMARNGKRQGGHLGIYRASREVNPITMEELQRVARIWAETALGIGAQHVKVMRRLAGIQARRSIEQPAEA
jgi:DSF synthase